MTSALRGEVGLIAENITDRLRERDSDEGDGVQNADYFADVIYGWSIMMREERGGEEGSKR